MDQAAAERKQSIAERAAKATQGKWWWIGDTAGSLCLAARRVSPWHNVIEIDDSLNRLTISEADRAFIGHARVDIEWLLSQLSASEERVRELEACLVGAIKCSTCEGSGQWEPPCSGCQEGYPVPHDAWCKTTDDCPECGGAGMSLPDEAVLNKCIALLPSPPQVEETK